MSASPLKKSLRTSLAALAPALRKANVAKTKFGKMEITPPHSAESPATLPFVRKKMRETNVTASVCRPINLYAVERPCDASLLTNLFTPQPAYFSDELFFKNNSIYRAEKSKRKYTFSG